MKTTSTHGLPNILHPVAGRADAGRNWDELRAELHDRAGDHDLIALWQTLTADERRVVLAAADLPRDTRLQPIERQPEHVRTAIRGAIHRMSKYGQRLRDRLDAQRVDTAAMLAARVRDEIIHGDTGAALHWLGLIEKGAA